MIIKAKFKLWVLPLAMAFSISACDDFGSYPPLLRRLMDVGDSLREKHYADPVTISFSDYGSKLCVTDVPEGFVANQTVIEAALLDAAKPGEAELTRSKFSPNTPGYWHFILISHDRQNATIFSLGASHVIWPSDKRGDFVAAGRLVGHCYREMVIAGGYPPYVKDALADGKTN